MKRFAWISLMVLLGAWVLFFGLGAVVALVAGDVAAGLVLVALTAAPVVWLLRRRRKRAMAGSRPTEPVPASAVGPPPAPTEPASQQPAAPPATQPPAPLNAPPASPRSVAIIDWVADRLVSVSVGLVLLVIVLAGIGAVAFGDGDDSASPLATTKAAATARTEPTETETETEIETEPEPSPPATTTRAQATTPLPADSGRLSEGEFESFRDVQAEVVDESLQFSEEIQACAVIGQTGDFVGFRECVGKAYSGFEEDSDFAAYTAEGLVDDADGQCRRALNSYVIVLSDFSDTVRVAHDVADRLDFNAMTVAFQRLPKQTTRYSRFALNALRACEPR